METVHIATNSGKEYDHLFPKAIGEKITIKRFAKLEDTVKFLPQAIRKTLYQTERIAQELIGRTPYETCLKIWECVFPNISYRKDEKGKEQIQSPQYTWAVRSGDCDDYTVLIVSIALNIDGLVPILRIAAYNEIKGYQHIYPVIILPDGQEVVMDCVAKKFDYEVPYLYKEDKTMELQFLNGLEGTQQGISNLGIDAGDLLDGYEGEDVGDLGKLKIFKPKSSGGGGGGGKLKNIVKKVQNTKIAQTVRKGLHLTNKINPAAALLRTGILIGLKTNLLRIAERLRFSYLTPEQVQAKGLDQSKINRLAEIRDQLEKIFFRAGGELKNFKKEILTGKGNRDKQVPLSGLEALDLNNYNQYHSPMQILGINTYGSEMYGVEGLGELGEAITAGAAVTAATGALTAIAALLKSIGDLKKNSAKNAPANRTEQGANTEPETPSGESDPPLLVPGTPKEVPIANDPFFTENNVQNKPGVKSNSGGAAHVSNNAENPATTDTAETSANAQSQSTNSTSESTGESTENQSAGENDQTKRNPSNSTPNVSAKETQSFVDKATEWVKKNPVPTIGIALALGLTTYAIVTYVQSNKQMKQETKRKEALAGLPHRRKNKSYQYGRIKTYKLK